MRRRWMLMNRLLMVALLAGAQLAPAAEPESTEGMTLLDAAGDGATLYVTGLLSREYFELKEMRVSASRLAGRAGDPDQFRMYLFDAEGGRLGVTKTWSPLLNLEWDMEGMREMADNQEKAVVTLQIPATFRLERVILGWPDGNKEIARLSVGDAIRQFCKEMPKNPACGAPLK